MPWRRGCAASNAARWPPVRAHHGACGRLGGAPRHAARRHGHQDTRARRAERAPARSRRDLVGGCRGAAQRGVCRCGRGGGTALARGGLRATEPVGSRGHRRAWAASRRPEPPCPRPDRQASRPRVTVDCAQPFTPPSFCNPSLIYRFVKSCCGPLPNIRPHAQSPFLPLIFLPGVSTPCTPVACAATASPKRRHGHR